MSGLVYYSLLLLVGILLLYIPCPLQFCWKTTPYGAGVPELTHQLRKSIYGSQKSLWQKESFDSKAKKGLYEAWFTIANDLESKESYWIRFTLNVPNKEISKSEGESLEAAIDRLGGSAAIWVMYFNSDNPEKNLAFKKKFPLSVVSGSTWNVEGDKPTIVKIGDNILTLDSLKGSFETNDGRKVKMDLKFTNFVKAYYPIPYIGWILKLTNTYVSNGHPNLRISGELEIDGSVKILKSANGHQTHTYGDSYIEPWTWFHCNTFEGHPDAFLECGYKTRLRKGSFGLFDGEHEWFFNTIFTMKKIKEVLKTPTHVQIQIDGKQADLFVDITVPKEKLIGLEYLGPKGNNFYCYNSETSTLRLSIKHKNGTLIKEMVAEDSLDFETVWFEPQEGLPYLRSDQEVWLAKNDDVIPKLEKVEVEV